MERQIHSSQRTSRSSGCRFKKNKRQIERISRHSLEVSKPPKNHSYSLSVIQLGISLVTLAGISFRAVSKLYKCLNICLHLSLGTPSHTTVLNWTKKQGIYQFREKEFYDQQRWVLIADESIQFGNKKLLLVLAVPEERCNTGQALTYSDLKPLVLKVSESWKSEDVAAEIRNHIGLKQIAYCISDSGSNLTRAFKLLKRKYIPDINHKFSRIVQSTFEEDPLFIGYTKALASLRAQRSMSKIARIVPPNQRVMSRYMNLTPLFKWGMKMTILLDTNQLNQEEKSALSFMEPYRDFISDTYHMLITLNTMQELLKNEGLNKKTCKESLSLLSDLVSGKSLKVRKSVEEYVNGLAAMIKRGRTICCSSDIIESCFGKYKEVVKGNKSVGISDLCLCIAAMLGDDNFDEVETGKAMETISMKHLKEWKNINICKTLFAEKQDLNRYIERNKI